MFPRRFAALVAFLIAFVAVFTIKNRRMRGPNEQPTAPTIPDRLEPEGDDPFTYAKVVREPGPPPARFAAPLPSRLPFSPQAWEAAPPLSHVQDLLCAGEADMEKRALEAMRAAAANGSAGADIGIAFASLVEWCGNCGFGAWARDSAVDEASQAEPPAVREAALHLLGACGDAADAAIFDAADTPPGAVVQWFDALEYGSAMREPAPPGALVRAASALAAAGDARTARRAAQLLAHPDTPERAAVLVAVHALATEPETRHEIAMAMARLSAAEARSIVEAACRERPASPHCRNRDPVDQARIDRRLQELFPEAAILGSATDSGPEPATAVTSAPDAATTAADAEATRDRLVAAGLLAPDATLPPATSDALDILGANGAAWAFDMETGMWPNEHDVLARGLARLVAPALHGVVFEEVPPTVDGSGEPYQVIAHADGQHVTVLAADFGDWWDVDAVVGLVNTLLRDRSSERRVLLAATRGDQVVTAIGGSATALRRAIEEELLRPGLGTGAVESSKAFEQKILDALGAEEPR